jgi:3-methyladenine DNA glycosylase AlkD
MSNPAARADAVLRGLREAWTPAADPARAAREAAYMRDQFVFLGLSTPVRRRLARSSLRDHLPRDESELTSVARTLWRQPEREFQYAACDYLRASVDVAGAGFVDVVRDLVSTKSWWDTVDALASRVAGPLVRRHPNLGEVMDAWVLDENIWVARTALLHQLTYRQATDERRLFAYCRQRAGDREFFLRKAIGWALRQYAATDPEAVAEFLAATPDLSPLSRREALRGVARATVAPDVD